MLLFNWFASFHRDAQDMLEFMIKERDVLENFLFLESQILDLFCPIYLEYHINCCKFFMGSDELILVF